jgi:hypothetical protein
MRTSNVIAFTVVASISAAMPDKNHLPIMPMYPVVKSLPSSTSTSSTSAWPTS